MSSKRNGLRFGLGVLLVFFFAWQHGLQSPSAWLSHLDQNLYDWSLSSRNAQLDDRIVIVDIDESSLSQIGRWPWNRETIAKLIVALKPAKVVGLDILFADRIQAEGSTAGFTKALSQDNLVLGYYFSSETKSHRQGQLPEAILPASALPKQLALTQWEGYGANLPEISQAAKHHGFFNAMADSDGVVRSLPVLAQFEGQVYESLVLAVFKKYLGANSLTLHDTHLSLKGKNSPAYELLLSDGASVLVPYRQGYGAQGGNFQYISAKAVLDKGFRADQLAGKIVLVGSSAPGLSDIRSTPLARAFPGVEVHASALSGLLDQSLKVRNDIGHLIALVALLVGGLALAWLLQGQSSISISSLFLVSLVALLFFGTLAQAKWHLILPLSSLACLSLLLAVLNLGLGYFTEGKDRRQMVRLFGEYVSPEVVDRMAADPKHFRQNLTQVREITVMFCDIRGFTRIAETMNPSVLSDYLNEYFTQMSHIIHAHSGTLDKYIGDAVMAFWGAPLEDACHAQNAYLAALQMQAKAKALSEQFVMRGLPPLQLGIGIHTGLARVGDLGSQLRRSYTAIGDTVNLAARIESLTKDYGAEILISEASFKQLQSGDLVQLDKVRVQGREEPVAIYGSPMLQAKLTAPKGDIAKHAIQVPMEQLPSERQLSVPKPNGTSEADKLPALSES